MEQGLHPPEKITLPGGSCDFPVAFNKLAEAVFILAGNELPADIHVILASCSRFVFDQIFKCNDFKPLQ